jgi:protoporphyrinogen oxidase
MAANHGLRTTGTHTGNFGRQKIQGKRETLDLTKEILNRENLRIPDPNESYNKLVIAYNTTTDAKLKAALWEMLRARKATLQPIKVKPTVKPTSEFGEYCRRTR